MPEGHTWYDKYRPNPRIEDTIHTNGMILVVNMV